MGVMLDLTTSMAQTLDLDALIIKIVNKITDILSSERATLFLIDDERDELWSKAAVGDELTEIRFPKNLGLAGHTATTGQTLNIKDAYADPRFNPDVDRQTGFTSRSILTMPVINRDGKLIGVTQAINKKEGVFESDDESLLKALTSQVAVALENAQLYRRTVSMKNYLASVQDSISNAILTLDPDRRVVTANRPAQRMFDLDMSTLKGVPLHELIGPENARFASLLEWVSQSGRPTIDYDVDLTLKNGDLHSVNVNLVPLVDPSEEHEGLVLVFEDITQEKRVKGALTRYMAKDIVDRVLEDPSGEALGGAAGTATTMFADIRGFTGLAEGMSAEETVEFLNHYFSLMVEVIFEQRGVLDKYIGDAIMAVFGVPYQQGDDAARAVQTALRMRSVLAGINAERLAAQRAPIRVGFGLCTGEVIYGNIGSAKRMDYTVIGDGVNVAARLEALTAAYGVDILISESTQQRIGDWFTTRPVDQVLFKGKKNPVEVYQVLGEGRWRLSQAEEYFSEGLQHYRDRRFDQAARAFQAGRAGDNLCRVFLERCRYFQECPPPPDWDGVWITDRK
jgi:adenylate cyclase